MLKGLHLDAYNTFGTIYNKLLVYVNFRFVHLTELYNTTTKINIVSDKY